MFVVHHEPGGPMDLKGPICKGIYIPGGIFFQAQFLGDGFNLQQMRLEKSSLLLCLSKRATVRQVSLFFVFFLL